MRLCLCAAVVAAELLWAAAAASPTPVTSWYMFGTSAADLRSYAYAHGCAFAQAQPGSAVRVLLLDFGAARKLDSSTWGAVDFSNTRFSNADILVALERAADGYHNCHFRGGVDIAYGNRNYHLSGSEMTGTDAWYAGYHQAERAEDLGDYQDAKGYTSQTADAAADMEPSWETAPVTKQLVNGNQAQGWALDYDFGSADGCPQSGSADGSCNNGWHVSDVGYAYFHGLALPLPEIYYTAPRRREVGRTRPPGLRRTTDASTAPAPAPHFVPHPIAARLLGPDVPVPVSPALLRPRNGWLVSDGSTLVAVYAGAAGSDQAVGRVVIVRQDLVAGRQKVETLDAGPTGALTIVSAETGKIHLRGAGGGLLLLELGKGMSHTVLTEPGYRDRPLPPRSSDSTSHPVRR